MWNKSLSVAIVFVQATQEQFKKFVARMASTAQDPQAPLQTPEKKEEDHDEDCESIP